MCSQSHVTSYLSFLLSPAQGMKKQRTLNLSCNIHLSYYTPNTISKGALAGAHTGGKRRSALGIK